MSVDLLAAAELVRAVSEAEQRRQRLEQMAAAAPFLTVNRAVARRIAQAERRATRRRPTRPEPTKELHQR